MEIFEIQTLQLKCKNGLREGEFSKIVRSYELPNLSMYQERRKDYV